MITVANTGMKVHTKKYTHEMEHNNNSIYLALSLFRTWLRTITTHQIIGVLTIFVLALTAIKYFYSIKKERLEIKRLERNN